MKNKKENKNVSKYLVATAIMCIVLFIGIAVIDNKINSIINTENTTLTLSDADLNKIYNAIDVLSGCKKYGLKEDFLIQYNTDKNIYYGIPICVPNEV
jgi:hypothetical protein